MERALVLTGGGARGAYQAGVLLRIAEICKSLNVSTPFPILAGSSAGAINAAMIANHAGDFYIAAQKLVGIWGRLEANQVFRADLPSLSKIGAKWIVDVTMGGIVGGGRAHSLLDTTPLERLLRCNLTEEDIGRNIAEGRIKALAITATNYDTGNAVSFV